MLINTLDVPDESLVHGEDVLARHGGDLLATRFRDLRSVQLEPSPALISVPESLVLAAMTAQHRPRKPPESAGTFLLELPSDRLAAADEIPHLSGLATASARTEPVPDQVGTGRFSALCGGAVAGSDGASTPPSASGRLTPQAPGPRTQRFGGEIPAPGRSVPAVDPPTTPLPVIGPSPTIQDTAPDLVAVPVATATTERLRPVPVLPRTVGREGITGVHPVVVDELEGAVSPHPRASELPAHARPVALAFGAGYPVGGVQGALRRPRVSADHGSFDSGRHGKHEDGGLLRHAIGQLVG